MTDEKIDFNIVDVRDRNETDQKIAQIKNILKEEGVENDPDLLNAVDEAVNSVITGILD